MAKESRRFVGPAPLVDVDLVADVDLKSPVLLYYPQRSHRRAESRTLAKIQRVSKRAALASKRKIWDSNDASIDAAQSAVDQWEAAYRALRGLLVASAHSAQGLYGAAKAGATGLEHGLLLPVRDWILLPAFGGVERVVGETVGFLQSDQAAHLAESSLDVVKRVPLVGDNILAPALVIGVDWAQKAWEIAKYPIPSKAAVRDSVDHVLTGTKWALSTAGREVYFYAKRMDANITRTLMHTQWRVLGSGPYSTLDKLHKSEILDHLCERYFSLKDPIARYELAAHIRAHNRPLYQDLVVTGVLRERGRDLTQDDEWLSLDPSYRSLESAFLLDPSGPEKVQPLWFRLPYQNGKRPGRDPWVCFSGRERCKLEAKYLSIVAGQDESTGAFEGKQFAFEGPAVEAESNHTDQSRASGSLPTYPTIASWYEPDISKDLFVDQRRHAVSFVTTCSQCGELHKPSLPPMTPKRFGDLCTACIKGHNQSPEAKFAPPPLAGIMRPTMWRFHGPGDELRRGVWFLDTKRHGLQPYGDESAAILEDAYLFLKWQAERVQRDDEIDGALLTVQVASPDGGEQQLVQFSSLTIATAISKTLGGAISIFKRRVYRGACLKPPSPSPPPVDDTKRLSIENIVDVDAGLRPLDSEAASVDDFVSVDADNEVLQSELPPDSNATLAVRLCDLKQIDFNEGDDSPEDDIDHLVLVVHGIGEMLQTIDLFGLSLPNLSSIVDCCGFLRKNHEDIQNVKTKLETRGRVEYLPVEWHEALALYSQRRSPEDESNSLPQHRLRSPNATMNDISLRTIPQMRAFANDTLLDVLYFMSPEHHDTIIDIVTHEMNFIVNKVYDLTNFTGKVSIMGHSLGSIITWDILANQLPAPVNTRVDGIGVDERSEVLPSTTRSHDAINLTVDADRTERPVDLASQTSAFSQVDIASQAPALGEAEESEEVSPNSSGWRYPQLTFDVDNAFMLGSPIAVFLMIRNQRNPLSEDFYLEGCSRVFNIFHPYDPVAYRIEPLLDPRNADNEPRIITHWNGGFRVQYHTKRLWKKIVNETLRTQQNVVDAVEERMKRLGLLDYNLDSIADEDDVSEYSSDDSGARRVVCGSLNEGRRIDYMLQEKEIEHANEYVAALAAHSSYWIEKDLSLFVAQQIVHSTIEASIADNGIERGSPNSFT